MRPISQCRPAASPRFFGQFLLERGRITSPQLLAAVRLQEEANVQLGQLAVDHGYLNADEVRHLNERQRTIDRRFGELAVDEGLLSSDQLQELLRVQAVGRLKLGEALVRLGSLTTEALEHELEAFRREQETAPASLVENYTRRPHREVLALATDILTKMLLRIGHETVKPAPCGTQASGARVHDWSVRQCFRGDLDLEVVLNLTSDLMARVASRMLEEPVAEGSEEARDGGAEFFNIVNGNLCSRLEAAGVRLEMLPPEVFDNRNGSGFDLIGAAADGQLTITPLVHAFGGAELCVVDRSADGWGR
jgi:CheY-specific phosphatase CheX